MQIPAGVGRQGSAERLTDGGRLDPVARQGPANQIEIHGACPCKTILWAVDIVDSELLMAAPPWRAARPSGFGLRCIPGGGHRIAGDLPHMLAGIGELA